MVWTQTTDNLKSKITDLSAYTSIKGTKPLFMIIKSIIIILQKYLSFKLTLALQKLSRVFNTAVYFMSAATASIAVTVCCSASGGSSSTKRSWCVCKTSRTVDSVIDGQMDDGVMTGRGARHPCWVVTMFFKFTGTERSFCLRVYRKREEFHHLVLKADIMEGGWWNDDDDNCFDYFQQ